MTTDRTSNEKLHQDLLSAGSNDAWFVPLDKGIPTSFPVVTLCGSTKFKGEFEDVKKRLTLEGKLVITLAFFGHTDMPEYDWSTDGSHLKIMLDRMHFQKIRMADYVFVVNPGNYIGESTAREIEYAKSLGKPIEYMVDHP